MSESERADLLQLIRGTRTTSEKFGKFLAGVAVANGRDLPLADKLLECDPSIEDTLRFRAELIAFLLLPLKVVIIANLGRQADRVYESTVGAAITIFRNSIENPELADDDHWEQLRTGVFQRLIYYPRIIGQRLTEVTLKQLSHAAYRNITNRNMVNHEGAIYLAAHFTTMMKLMGEAVTLVDIVDDGLRSFDPTKPADPDLNKGTVENFGAVMAAAAWKGTMHSRRINPCAT